MNEYLIFRIYGTMASWGDIAVGEFRPSYDRPSKSAIMGMVAAALGIRRDEEERLQELAAGYLMAVRIDAPGILMRDYHTAQVPPSIIDRKKMIFPTRKAELSVPKDVLNTILSSRDYRCDAIYSICLWSRTASPPYPLTALKEHLEKPVFTLYLGRKSCPLSLPLQPQIIPSESIAAALSSVQFNDAPFLFPLESNGDARVFWEGDADVGFTRVHTFQRRDDPLSRRRWQFGNRTEHSAMIRKPAGG
ncbi:type I-E CRISPR-associated protein Cas5/CasD [Methanoregula sp.]|uniref:type I-E CRISPR-associated protein Cas5/CasD n=1 Tax=Methanoregula sp. TaxID=2052170 RepID=UPI00356434A1